MVSVTNLDGTHSVEGPAPEAENRSSALQSNPVSFLKSSPAVPSFKYLTRSTWIIVHLCEGARSVLFISVSTNSCKVPQFF